MEPSGEDDMIPNNNYFPATEGVGRSRSQKRPPPTPSAEDSRDDLRRKTCNQINADLMRETLSWSFRL
jgi:hypothetical protein